MIKPYTYEFTKKFSNLTGYHFSLTFSPVQGLEPLRITEFFFTDNRLKIFWEIDSEAVAAGH